MILHLAQALPTVPPPVAEQIRGLSTELGRLQEQVTSLESAAGLGDGAHVASRLSIFHGYLWVLVVAFLVSLIATPIMRRLAVTHGVVDRPGEARKLHRQPTAYLGGVAVYLGIIAAVAFSYAALVQPGLIDFHDVRADHAGDSLLPAPVPLSIVLGLTVIMLVGMIDDVTGLWPRVKVGGQLMAAAALAIDDVGVKVAAGVMAPIGRLIGSPDLVWNIPLPFQVPVVGVGSIEIDAVYWTGTAIIAIFVLGACNASNLIDGLDGLLSGVTAIAMMGLLVIALGLALHDHSARDAQRIILCMAVLGACLGFLPHNFNPANIFLGDSGSLLLGFCTCVIILTLGEQGRTELVIAGLIIYALPIIDTVLAIVRRKMAHKRISSADDQHLHHMLKRALGVKGAVLSLYAIAASFAVFGVMISEVRARAVYVLALVFAASIGVYAIKIARKKQLEDEMAGAEAARATKAGAEPARPRSPEPVGTAPKSPASP
ncbi:MAG: undecaprenyl/decaprenyl-phosphate alpha-N-acetylglucosaminyl 1-phosphate transferase [Phycisphaerae bacterium]|nr:undecaprenyl/decaprenyl-phosphate alpha-N-acetylglucosaminyl 1-phosphate transferase [Phycisphaerae bacterium]